MERFTDAIWLRCAYDVVAREKGRQLDSHQVSEPVPVRFRVVDASRTTPYATVARPRSRSGWNARAPGDEADQVVEFRSVEGALMRPVVDATGVPIRVADVERHARERHDWSDYPAPLVPWGRFLCPAHGVRDRETSGLKDFKSSGREAAMAAMARLNGGMRAVDGVLWRPTAPPCWSVDRFHDGGWRASACVLDLDHPEVDTRHASSSVHSHVVDGRTDVNALLAALDEGSGRVDRGRINVRGSVAFRDQAHARDADLAETNLWILREAVAAHFGATRWGDLSPARKATLARLELAVDDALAGRVGIEVALDDVKEQVGRMAAEADDEESRHPRALREIAEGWLATEVAVALATREDRDEEASASLAM